MKPLQIRSTTDGLLLAWAETPASGPCLWEQRGAVLFSNSQPVQDLSMQGGQPKVLPEDSQGEKIWREVTLMDGWNLQPEQLGDTLRVLSQTAKMIRLNWPVGSFLSKSPSLLLDGLASGEEMICKPDSKPSSPSEGHANRVLKKHTSPQPNLLMGSLVVHLQWFLDVTSDGGLKIPPWVEPLLQAGFPLAGEVFFADALPPPEPLGESFRAMMAAGVRPYFLVLGDWLPPSRRIDKSEGMERVVKLRGWISGTALPQIVQETCQGQRIPLIPPYTIPGDGPTIKGWNYRGASFTYGNPEDDQTREDS